MRRSTLYLCLLTVLLLGSLILTICLYIQRKDHSDRIVLYGNVDVRQVDIGFRVAGRVIEMPFQEGDYVPKGTLMGVIEEQPYLDQVKEAEANVEKIRIELVNAEAIWKRREQLLPDGAVSQEDHDNALTFRNQLAAQLQEVEAALGVAMKNLHDTRVYCPNDGTILTRIREPGTMVLSSEPIYILSLIDPIWVRAFVPEPLLGEIYFGMPATVHTDSGRSYKGHIGFISPVAEFTPKTVQTPELRTDLVYRLRIIADNPDRYMKQGMPVTVDLYRGGGGDSHVWR